MRKTVYSDIGKVLPEERAVRRKLVGDQERQKQ